MSKQLKEYEITTTLVSYVEAETEEKAQEEFNNLSDYGDIVNCDIEEVSDERITGHDLIQTLTYIVRECSDIEEVSDND
jgi:hypothetical protein